MASGVDAKLLKSTKFPAEFSKKVDMEKVNLEVMKQWIARKVVDILGSEDDVVIDFVFGMLEGERYPDPKRIQLNLTGFLEKETPPFCKQLWILLLSAQANAQGVPSELLEAKKEELRQQKIEAEKAAEIQRKKRERENAKDRELEAVRQRERETRGGDRRRRISLPPERGTYRPRNDELATRDRYLDRNDRNPRSPPRNGGGRRDRGGLGAGARRETDTYIPSRRESYRRDFDDREDRSERHGESSSRARSPRSRNRRGDYYDHSQYKYSSRSPELHRVNRAYSRSVSADRGRGSQRHQTNERRSIGRRDLQSRRTHTPSSYTISSSTSSRSISRSSYESSRSRGHTSQKDRHGRSVSSRRYSRDRRHKRSCSPSHKTHADRETRTSEAHRRYSFDYEDSRSGKDGAKRRRSPSIGQDNKRATRKTNHREDRVRRKEESREQQELGSKQQENLLREKLLREKIKQSRNNSNTGLTKLLKFALFGASRWGAIGIYSIYM